ncbi:MAG: hypothetical protein AAGC81_11695 [Pseudomonadota bacterium]
MRTLMLISALSLTTPALACPTSADLDGQGIKVTFDDGSSSIFKRAKPNVILEETAFPDSNEGFWLELWDGLYPIGSGGLIDGKRDPGDVMTTKYPSAYDQLPAVKPNVNWSNQVEDFDGNNQSLGKADVTVWVGKTTKMAIGECIYDGIDASTVISHPGNSAISNLIYLTDLGIAVLIGEGSSQGGMNRLKPTSISVAR